MISLVNLIKENRFFFSINLILIAVVGLYICIVSRVEGFIMMNSFHTQFLNYIFNLITFIGDGLFTIILSILFFVFFKKYRKLSLVLLIAYLSSGIFAQVFKNLIHAPRPSLYFAMHNYTYYIDTFANSRSGFTSFPSGHSSSAFALITVLSIYCKRKYMSIFFITTGVLAGYSRVYLAHHFLIDVFAGAIIGILFAGLSVVWINEKWDTIVNFFAQKLYRNNNQQSPNLPSLQ